MLPETKFARSGEVRIAYQITGEGPIDLIWVPGIVSHLDLDWDYPPRARFCESLSSFCRLIRFDKRGTGLSDRPMRMATLDERADDIRAVMDAADCKSGAILAWSEGAAMACLFAATYPERTRCLILWGAQARWVKTDDYRWGQTADEYEHMIEDVRERWPSKEYILGAGAGMGPGTDPIFVEWSMRYCRAAASPSAAAAYERMNSQIDVRAILPTITVPTLVMNRTGDPVADVNAARDMAARIPGARFVEFPGNTHMIFTHEPESVLAEIEEFLTGTRPATHSDRILATVLFLDLVESTKRASEVGDKEWRNLLQTYYAVVRKTLARYRGREIDTSGDGFFITFDGPARAISCALELTQVVQQTGLEVRAGLHAGECEVIGEKVGGIAVNIGARIVGQATAGEVIVSSTVRDLVAGSGIRFEDRGVHALKGVLDPWHLYAVAR